MVGFSSLSTNTCTYLVGAPSLLICSEIAEVCLVFVFTRRVESEGMVFLYSVYNELKLNEGTRWLGARSVERAEDAACAFTTSWRSDGAHERP